MKVIKGTVRDLGSCNFCDKGRLSGSVMGLDYPYKEVTQFEASDGGGMRVRICEDCAIELFETMLKGVTNGK